MKTTTKALLMAWMTIGLMALGLSARAGEGPYEIVAEVTDTLVAAAREHRENPDQEAFDTQVLEALEPVVAFDYIARVVMGEHYKKATAEQRERFSRIFKTGLVSTYAKGIATYAHSDITLVEPGEPVGDQRRVSVEQEVSHEGEKHRLSYSMAKNKEGEWKLINLVLNGVNLGRSFSSQFSQLASRHGGDIDKIIDNWEAEEATD